MSILLGEFEGNAAGAAKFGSWRIDLIALLHVELLRNPYAYNSHFFEQFL
jgi:hypothetical protein